jgi:hypothetical protein
MTMASINVPTEFTAEQHRMMREAFGKAAAEDERTKLFDTLQQIDQAQMRQIVRAGNEPVTVELHAARERKTMADGTVYEVDECGCWKRVHEG